jgi:hypothetical protein
MLAAVTALHTARRVRKRPGAGVRGACTEVARDTVGGVELTDVVPTDVVLADVVLADGRRMSGETLRADSNN